MNLLQAGLNVGMTILPRLDAEPSLCFTALTLQEFANSIIAATKEEDAKICEDESNNCIGSKYPFAQAAALHCAKDIRSSKP